MNEHWGCLTTLYRDSLSSIVHICILTSKRWLLISSVNCCLQTITFSVLVESQSTICSTESGVTRKQEKLQREIQCFNLSYSHSPSLLILHLNITCGHIPLIHCKTMGDQQWEKQFVSQCRREHSGIRPTEQHCSRCPKPSPPVVSARQRLVEPHLTLFKRKSRTGLRPSSIHFNLLFLLFSFSKHLVFCGALPTRSKVGSLSLLSYSMLFNSLSRILIRYS